ncbi:MAG: flippase [Opitutaceae bacterium]|nr:flippase [Opitutaceae bacterium]
MQQMADALAKPGLQRAAANFGWLMLERALRFALGAIVGFVVARYLGPVRLGTFSYCLALVTLLGFVPALGLDAIVKRELIKAPHATAELIASALALRAAGGVLGFMAVWLATGWGAGFTAEEAQVFRILGLLLFQPALFLPDLWLQAHLRAKQAVAVQLVALACASGLRVWLVMSGAEIAAFAWVLVVEMILGAVGLWVLARRGGLPGSFLGARRARMQGLLAEAWPLMFAGLAILVYMKIDEVMLRQMTGPADVGVYAAAARLSEVWYFLPSALAASVLPGLLQARASGAGEYARRQQQYYDLSAAAAYALSVPVALCAPWIVRLAYGEAFVASGPILAVHIWSSIFVFLGVARGQWLVNEGLQRFYLVATLIGALANVLLNLAFIPRWGGLGAAYATVISYGLAAWAASYLHPRVRVTAAMQTRALLIPLRGWRYLRR